MYFGSCGLISLIKASINKANVRFDRLQASVHDTAGKGAKTCRRFNFEKKSMLLVGGKLVARTYNLIYCIYLFIHLYIYIYTYIHIYI